MLERTPKVGSSSNSNFATEVHFRESSNLGSHQPEVRGEFLPIRPNVSGIEVGELFARIADLHERGLAKDATDLRTKKGRRLLVKVADRPGSKVLPPQRLQLCEYHKERERVALGVLTATKATGMPTGLFRKEHVIGQDSILALALPR